MEYAESADCHAGFSVDSVISISSMALTGKVFNGCEIDGED